MQIFSSSFYFFFGCFLSSLLLPISIWPKSSKVICQQLRVQRGSKAVGWGEGAGSALRTLCAGLGELSGLTRCVDICYTLFASGRGLPQKNALTKRDGGSVVRGGRCQRVEPSRGDSQIASNINRAYVKCLKLS